MSMGKGGWSHSTRHTDMAAGLVRACVELPCSLWGSPPLRRSVGTCAAGVNTTDPLPDCVVSACEVLRSGTAVGEMASPSRPRDRTADAADVSVAVAPDIAAAAAVIGAAVVDGVVGAVATLDASAAYDPVAGYDLDHHRGAWLSVCRGGLAHRLHLQPRFGRRPHYFAGGCWPLNALRFISRVGVVHRSPVGFLNITCTRAKYSATWSLTPISNDPNSLFTLSYAASCVSATFFVSACHASEEDPISITVSMISVFFSRTFVNAYHTLSEFSTRL